MKFLIAFALFAVAFADVEPFRLREAPAPTIEGTFNYSPYLVEVVHSIAAPELSADVPSTYNIVTVANFVRGKLNTIGGVKASFDEAEPVYDRTVKFVDEAVTEEHVKENLLKVVTSPLEEATPSDFAVKVVDKAVNKENEKKSLVNVVESLLKETTPSDFAVKVVDEAVNEDNVKQSLVKVVESPLKEATPSDFAVKVVDEAVNEDNVKKSHVKVVESPLKEATPSDFAVKVVDEAVNEENVKQSFVKVVEKPIKEATPSDFTVKVVDEAVNENVKQSLVKLVESPLKEATPSDFAVKVVDEAVNEENVKQSLVKVVETPIKEATPTEFSVKVVDEAVNVEHVKSLAKLLTSPLEEATPANVYVNFVDEAVLTDESVKDEESPLEDAGRVNFVNELTSNDAEIAPSFDSYAGISKLIKAALEEKSVEGSSTVTVVSPEMNIPTAVNVVENAMNMGNILAVEIDDYYEGSVDLHDTADIYDDHRIPANVVRVAEFPRGKVFDDPMLR